MKRKLGMNADAIEGVAPLAALDLLRAAGFDSFFVLMSEKDEIKALKERANALGLAFEFIHAPFRGINAMWLAGMEYLTLYNGMKDTIDAAAEAGVPTVIMHLSSGWEPPAITEVGLARYDGLVLYARERGVTVAFENLRAVGNLAYIIDRYEKLENVRFCYDCGHEHCYTKTMVWPDLFTDRIAATHIHDNMGRGKEKVGDPDLHLLPFDGNLDYAKMMRKLDEYEYSGSLMLEVFTSADARYKAYSPEAFVATCFERIRRISDL